MAKRIPEKKKLTRTQIQRRVNMVRIMMRTGAKQMVDMNHTIGPLASFDTEEGTAFAGILRKRGSHCDEARAFSYRV